MERAMKNLKTQWVVSLFFAVFALSNAYGQLTPSADAYTNTADPSTNYGAATLLYLKGATETAYIQFNLGSIPANYTGADVAQATLKVYVGAVTTAGSFNVVYVNGSWAESSITSSLAPALGTTIASSVPLVTADKNQFILIDVTPAMQAWLSGTANDGIALVGNGTVAATFDSKENTTTSHAPELDIQFTGGGTLTGVTTASGSGLTGGGTSGTLNLGLLTTCAAGQVLEWNGSAWACASLSGGGTITGVTAGTDLTGGGTTGTVTLNLNTSTTDGRYARLGANNTFTGKQTINSTADIEAASTAQTLNVVQTGTGATGDGIHGITSSPGGTGVFGEGAIGLQGLATSSTGLSGLFRGTVQVTGNGNNLLVGDPGCGSGYAGLGAPASGSLSGCVNYALAAGPNGGTYINASGTATIHFRSNNNELATIDNSGNVDVIGQNGGGNMSVAGNLTVSGNQTTALGPGGGFTGFSAQAGSSLNGRDGVNGAGGNGDPNDEFSNGGIGVKGVGGTGGYAGGTGGYFVGGAQGGLAGSGSGDGVDAYAGSGANYGFAGYFAGDIDVTGKIYAGTKDFQIDHPLDPANKYLVHASVESSEMMNIYTGNVTTDSQGIATVQLPDWFEALNTDFRYQLTVIGQFAQAIVASEISHNQFSIRTDKANVKVSWQVTGVRQDAFAKANPLVVEQQKDARLRGYYIHPEFYGAPEEKQIEWARHPEMMKEIRETRARKSAAQRQ